MILWFPVLVPFKSVVTAVRNMFPESCALNLLKIRRLIQHVIAGMLMLIQLATDQKRFPLVHQIDFHFPYFWGCKQLFWCSPGVSLSLSWENLLFDKGKMKKLDKLAPCTVLSSDRFLPRASGISSDQRTKEMLINPRPEKLIPKKQISSFSTVNCTEKRSGVGPDTFLGQPEKKPMNLRFDYYIIVVVVMTIISTIIIKLFQSSF